MGNRTTAIGQLIGLVYLVTIYPVVLTIGAVGGLVFMVIDVLKKLIQNEPAMGGNVVTGWGMRLWMWPVDQVVWIVNGEGDFPILP